MDAISQRLPAYSLFGAVLSAAGLPIYIYAPKFYADNYGVSLTALGAVLFGLRFLDFIQDPILGWLSERLTTSKKKWIALGSLLLAASMICLFAVAPPINSTVWFGLTVTALFTAFSFLSINFYAQGVEKASTLRNGHVRLAAWRETGSLLGVCLAAILPTLLLGFVASPFAVFAVAFATVAILATILMWPEWTAAVQIEPSPISRIWNDAIARRLLILAIFNAAPLAVTSTLFLFFVESRLGAVGWEGPLLLLFFLTAALSSPIWSRLALAYGAKLVLLCAMSIAVAAFAYTLTLSVGNEIQFAVICVITGATIGADLTLLPAMFAQRLAKIAPKGGQGFGLWSLASKFTLAFAAVILLPALERAGYTAGQNDLPASTLTMLTLLYAGVPSILKLVAIAILASTNLEN